MLLRVLAVVVLVLGALLAIALTWGAWRWRGASQAARARLDGPCTAPARYHESDLAGLPVPVQRWFRRVLRDGQPRFVHARIEQEGTFLVKEQPATWGPFVATQDFRDGPPGFVWEARIRMAPAVYASIRDSYVLGVGAMRGELAKLVPVVNQHDTPEMASGSLVRWLAETPWFPTALLPGAGVTWSAIDDSTARASITDRGVTVWMDFRFDASGDLVSSSTTSRAHTDASGTKYLPWNGRYWNWAERSGVRIPLEAEVAWIVDGRAEPYFRGRVTKVEYTLAR